MHPHSFSYDEASPHQLEVLLLLARQSTGQLPVYSADVALALQIPHRVLKDIIESHYRELRHAYGTRVHVVRHKGRGLLRSMDGYFLPFQAIAQLLMMRLEGNSLSLLSTPELIHACYSAGRFSDSLN